ncbi:MAG: aldehyde dehydrogenase [Bacteroidia bacterium]
MGYSETINSQRLFFNSNATKNIDFRITQLKKLKSLLQENESKLYKAIYSDFKKSEFETYATELGLLYHDIDEAIKKVKSWSRKKRVKTNFANFPARSIIIPEPLGVSLIIGAWNYPYLLSLSPVVAAIAAGNTVMLKPSEISSGTSAIMAQLINQNFTENYFTVIEGGPKETSALLEIKFDKIFFTGSVPVGKIIYQAAAKNLTPVTLELGGKSPAFITKECNLKETVKRLVWAKFLNAGQTCIAPDYVLVDEKIKELFLKTVKEQIKKFDYKFENENYVQIISDKNVARLEALIEKDKIYYGGIVDSKTRYISPTILTAVTFDDAVMKDEIFGPILPVISYSKIEDAIKEVKARPKPLSCYVFTSDENIKKKILFELSFGGGAVNDAVMHISNSHLPFGGVGDSGTGSYHGEAGFKAFSHYKSILEKPFWFEPDFKYSPYSKKKFAWIKRFIG